MHPSDCLVVVWFLCSLSRWRISWVSWQQKSSRVFPASRKSAKLSRWSWKSGRNLRRRKLQNSSVKPLHYSH